MSEDARYYADYSGSYTDRSLVDKEYVDELQYITENSQSGTSYTLVLTDDGKVVTCTNGSAITVTVPPNSSVAFPTGTMIIIEQWGAGTVTIAEGAAVTINSIGGALAFTGQYATAVLRKDAADVWILSGAIE